MKFELLDKKLEILDKLQDTTGLLDQTLKSNDWDQVKLHMERRQELLEEYERLDETWKQQLTFEVQQELQQSVQYGQFTQLIRERIEWIVEQMRKHEQYIQQQLQGISQSLHELNQIKHVARSYASIDRKKEARFFDKTE